MFSFERKTRFLWNIAERLCVSSQEQIIAFAYKIHITHIQGRKCMLYKFICTYLYVGT